MSRRERAVVADPNGDTFVHLEPVLSKLGLHAIGVSDGDQALRLIVESPPSLVLAETGLEGIDGLALCAHLRQNKSTHFIPIVLMGTGDDREGRLAALGAGADDFLSKPLDSEDAKLRLAALLRRARLRSSTNGNRREIGVGGAAGSTTRDLYARLVDATGQVLEQARRDEPLALKPLHDGARDLTRQLGNISTMARWALEKTEIENLAAHHVNVAIIGLTLAQGLGLPPDLLSELVLLALVHDLGMVRIPAAILYAPRRLSREEFRVVTEHPRHTYEMLKSAGSEHARLAELAYQEHEREKGQGYPQGLTGDQTHELAKILAVADVFEALTHPRAYRKGLIAYEALQKLVEMRGDVFHPRYIRALMNTLTVFPPGSWVQLNTGETGIVRSTNSKNLMRPVVEVIWNARGERLEGQKEIDLAKSPFLFVSKPLYEEELPRP